MREREGERGREREREREERERERERVRRWGREEVGGCWTHLLIQLDHGAGQGVASSGGAPDGVGGERVQQHWAEGGAEHRLQLLPVRIPAEETRKILSLYLPPFCSTLLLSPPLPSLPSLPLPASHPTLQIRATEVNREDSWCRPRVEPGFMDATTCTPSSPTHSSWSSWKPW